MVTPAETSLCRVSFHEEATWGTSPATALQEIRITGESLKGEISTTPSAEIRSDRQVTDCVIAGESASGDISFELAYGGQDSFLEGLLGSDWTSDLNISGSGFSCSTDNTITASSSKFASVAVGQWIKTAGFGSTANNGYFRVTAASATQITVDNGAATLATEALGASVTIEGSRLVNSTGSKSYSIEKEYTSIASTFVNYTGMRVGGATLNIETGAPIRGSFSFMGKAENTSTTTIGSAVTAAVETSVFDGNNNVSDVRENGAAATFEFSKMSINFSNGLRVQTAVGETSAIGIGIGTLQVSGTLTAYFSSKTLYDKFLNGTSTYMSIRVVDADGNAYIITLQRMKFTGGSVVIGGKDQDVMADLSFQCYRDATYEKTVCIDKFAA